MGISSYRSGSKGSSVSSESGRNRKGASYSSLRQIISVLEELDAKRQAVAKKEYELEKAKNDVTTATQKAQKELEKLDSATRDLILGMLNQISEKNVSSVAEETKRRGM